MAITVRNFHSLVLVEPDASDSEAFWQHVEDHVVGDLFDETDHDHTPYQTFGNALVVEPRYLSDALVALKDDGFQIQLG